MVLIFFFGFLSLPITSLLFFGRANLLRFMMTVCGVSLSAWFSFLAKRLPLHLWRDLVRR